MNVGAKVGIIFHISSVLNKQKFYRSKHFEGRDAPNNYSANCHEPLFETNIH